jgi:hypothetical protein
VQQTKKQTVRLALLDGRFAGLVLWCGLIVNVQVPVAISTPESSQNNSTAETTLVGTLNLYILTQTVSIVNAILFSPPLFALPFHPSIPPSTRTQKTLVY